jgi:parallel beta-helix repeat protein
MKKVLIIFVFLFSHSVFCGYATPGTGVSWNLTDLVTNSGGVVTFSSGTYFINGDSLRISNSDTLKILSNATVKIAFNSVVHIRGTLIVSPPDSVKFTSVDTNQLFYEMRIDTSSSTILHNLIFEYSFNGLRIFDSSPLLAGCIFRNNCFGNPSATAPAINLFRSNAIISNCSFKRNYKAAIAGGANIPNAPQILYSQFYENNYANVNTPQINLGQSGAGTTIIRGNFITGQYIMSGGIAALPIGTLTVIIENNIIKKNRYGIALNGSVNAIIRNNVIDSNNIQGLPLLGGSGLNFVGSGITALVSKNIIRGNLWGVTLQNSAAPVFGDLTSPDTNYAGMNQIYNNSNSGVFYDFYNNTPNPIKAENNYWGTMNPDSVEAHIFHQPDSAALGFVDYIPLWSPTGIQQTGNEVPPGYRLYNAYPNPFNPQTNIRFDVAFKGDNSFQFVLLEVYDVSGKLVQTLVNSNLRPGSYEVKFDGENLSSGVYFYSLFGENFKETKKFILLK